MEIYIPVTLNKQNYMQKTNNKFQTIHTISQQILKQIPQKTHQKQSKQNNIHFLSLSCSIQNDKTTKFKNKDQFKTVQDVNLQNYQQNRKQRVRQTQLKVFYNSQTKKSIQQDELQKKATRQSDSSQLCIKQVKSLNKVHYSQAQLTQNDLLAVQVGCKVCLDSNLSQNYQQVQNPIIKVCKCNDQIHLKCLQQWINHRDIINQNINVYWCEVCQQKYNGVNIRLATFFSCQYCYEHFGHNINKEFCAILPILLTIILIVFDLYVLLRLIIQKDQQNAYIKSLINMPYNTCIVILLILLSMLIIVFFVVFYGWLKQKFYDEKYTVQQAKHLYQMKRVKIIMKNRV